MGANLLLNVGPQPNGEIPAAALERFKAIGQWLGKYGETFYATEAGDFKEQPWGTSTRKGDKLYVHVFDPKATEITVPTAAKVKKAVAFDTREPLKYTKLKEGGISIKLPAIPEGTIDYIIELEAPVKK